MRWDDLNTWILCWWHHAELHWIGETTFMKKYGLDSAGYALPLHGVSSKS